MLDIIKKLQSIINYNKKYDACKFCGNPIKNRKTISLCKNPRCEEKWIHLSGNKKLKVYRKFLKNQYRCPICKIKKLTCASVPVGFTCGKCGNTHYY